MKHSSGFFIKNKDLFLVCHPYGSPWTDGCWSIPKGGINKNESALEAAVRETYEESGINILKFLGNISYLGEFTYPNKKKKISVFLFDSLDDLLGFKCTCITNISSGKFEGKPEVDFYKWVSLEEASLKLHSVNLQVIEKIKAGMNK